MAAILNGLSLNGLPAMTPIRIAILYFVIGALWILVSDTLLYRLVDDPVRLTYWQSVKGWFFILASTLLLYALAQRLRTVLSRELDVKRQHLAVVRRKAYTDHLTGLPNRRFGLRAIRRLIQRAKREQKHFCVMCLDLDNFKQINDTLGHSAGDQLIQAVGKRLHAFLTEDEQLVRHGGNEFLLLCADVEHAEEIDKRAGEFVALFQEPFLIGPMPLRVTASIGVACYPEGGEGQGTLMRNADLALHHSKLYKNCFKVYESTMSRAMHYRFDLEQKMREALEENLFEVFYQPIYDPHKSCFTGAEALLRWPDDEGYISPVEFIPVAEQSGQIRALGAMVLARACHETQQLSERAGRPLSISVNVSPKQFANDHIVRDVQAALSASALDPGCLILEITEGVFLSNAAETGEILNQLMELGVSLSMDDFGQGYSSLSYLRKHPFRYLKIDKVFVQGMDSSGQDRALVEASVAMAEALNLQVVGEGVETATQQEALKELGVHYLQGFHLARPMPITDYEYFLLSAQVS
ncbi:bifunctional diguanylate cyclase/phosphodiesterase [Marinimicrobium sp. ABcell2]|uniref:putative bifunctional diguanylate cyclase/phosphodiesterase n=1 Tax=Marinimicrobium sp. ABcell2 TaxID=3069751 RepID=UPI0027B10701|nr:EAL domain-containing protein [Marinimicrobium sp. ABcell2]MDQ2075505.1 EAL domain-containing protein [Marinimicrobium sp. ABcell2]